MKRTIAILLAALMLTGILSACSGTVGMEDGRAYGNVSTTPDGTVNGTNRNGSYGGGSYGSNSNGYGAYGGYNGGYGSYNGGYNGSTSSGTGMTGGR